MHDPTDPPPNDAHRALPALDQAQEGDRAPASLHSIRALKSDLEAFDAWCRRNRRIALPATPEVVADYLDARVGQGGKPASLARYRASIAKLHRLLDLKDPMSAPLVKLRLAAVRREKGSAQTQARPLRFKGPVRDVEGGQGAGAQYLCLARKLPGRSARLARPCLAVDRL